MNMRKLIPIVVLLIFLIVGCSKPQIVNNSPLVIDQNNKIEVELKISTYNQKGKVIEGVELILIGYDGEVIDTLKTDSKGEVIKKIAVSLDNRYSNTVKDELGPRGTITIIAFKDGYRETVLFEAGASLGASFQQILMNPIVEGERNEPEVYLGNSHHLEILSLVNKYGELIEKEAHY